MTKKNPPRDPNSGSPNVFWCRSMFPKMPSLREAAKKEGADPRLCDPACLVRCPTAPDSLKLDLGRSKTAELTEMIGAKFLGAELYDKLWGRCMTQHEKWHILEDICSRDTTEVVRGMPVQKVVMTPVTYNLVSDHGKRKAFRCVIFSARCSGRIALPQSQKGEAMTMHVTIHCEKEAALLMLLSLTKTQQIKSRIAFGGSGSQS